MAEQMEHLLDEIAERGLLDLRWHCLLDALKPQAQGKSGRLTLPGLLKAKHEGTLELLIRSLDDPTLDEAFAECLRVYAVGSERQRKDIRSAVATTRRFVPSEARTLAYLRDARHIQRILAAAEASGLRRNSVRRAVYMTLSKLLVLHLGRSERDRVFVDVHFPKQDDTRDVLLTPAEITALLSACRGVSERLDGATGFDVYVLLALATGADKAPLQRLRAKDMEIISRDGQLSGSIHLDDRKTQSRRRTVRIADSACRALLPLLEGRDLTEQIFAYSDMQHWRYFKEARELIGMPQLRFKDLRSQFAIYGERAGMSTAVLQAAMGHASPHMQARYKTHTAAMDERHAEALEAAMGFSRKPEMRKVS